MLTVYFKLQPFSEVGSPAQFNQFIASQQQLDPTINPADFSLSLVEVKTYKENEIRDAADAWYRGNIRAFEGAIVGLKDARRSITADEIIVRDKILSNYERLRVLISKIRAIVEPSQISELIAIKWEDPVSLEDPKK